MKLKGYIKFQKKVMVRGQECYGCARGNKDKFSIRISREAAENSDIFMETVFHELLHLGHFVIMACTRQSWSEREQHQMLDKIMPVVLRELRKHTKGD